MRIFFHEPGPETSLNEKLFPARAVGQLALALALAHTTHAPREKLRLIAARVGRRPMAHWNRLESGSGHTLPGQPPARVPVILFCASGHDHTALGKGPSDHIKIVFGHSRGIVLHQFGLDEGQHIRRLVAHDAAEDTGGRHIDTMIGRGERNGYLNGAGSAVHGTWRIGFDRSAGKVGRASGGWEEAEALASANC